VFIFVLGGGGESCNSGWGIDVSYFLGDNSNFIENVKGLFFKINF